MQKLIQLLNLIKYSLRDTNTTKIVYLCLIGALMIGGLYYVNSILFGFITTISFLSAMSITMFVMLAVMIFGTYFKKH